MFTLDKVLRTNIRKLMPYSSARDEYSGTANVFLDANENPFNSGLNRYPDPYQVELKKAVACEKELAISQVFIGNGSDEAIDLLIRAFCNPGMDSIITVTPSYGMYNVSAEINDVGVIQVPLKQTFQLDVQAILKQATVNTKLLFICNPNNPTGNIFIEEDLQKLIVDFPGIVVLDEAYIDFISDASFEKRLANFPNLVVLQTFSKAWGLANLRLGMALGSVEIIEVLNRIKPPYNVSGISQKLALKTYLDKAEKEERVEAIVEQRENLREELEKFSFVQKIFPSEANFLLVKMDEPKEVYEFLLTQKIIVRNRSMVYGCEGCLRISVGTVEENKALLLGLKEFESVTITTK